MMIWLRLLSFVFSAGFSAVSANAGSIDWIGRVNYSGFSVSSHCTGSLISPNLVLTAAHCLISGRTGKPIKPKKLIFRAGYHLGESIVDVQGRDVIFLKGYLEADSNVKKATLDASIIVLDTALDIKPGKVSALNRNDNEFQFMGYTVIKPHILTESEKCSRKRGHETTITIACSSMHGQSGSPVISKETNKIVGIVIGFNAARETIILNLAQLKHLDPYLLEGKVINQ